MLVIIFFKIIIINKRQNPPYFLLLGCNYFVDLSSDAGLNPLKFMESNTKKKKEKKKKCFELGNNDVPFSQCYLVKEA